MYESYSVCVCVCKYARLKFAKTRYHRDMHVDVVSVVVVVVVDVKKSTHHHCSFITTKIVLFVVVTCSRFPVVVVVVVVLLREERDVVWGQCSLCKKDCNYLCPTERKQQRQYYTFT